MSFIIPSPKGTGLFRCCCLQNNCIKNNGIWVNETWVNKLTKHSTEIKSKLKLEEDEYFFTCVSSAIETCNPMSSKNDILLSNYGKLARVDFTHYHHKLDQITLLNTYKMIDQNIFNRIIKHKALIYNYGKNPNNPSDTWSYTVFNYTLMNDILTEYSKDDKDNQYNMEKSKLEIQRMTRELQEKEMKYINLKLEVDSKIKFIDNEEIKLKKEILLYKEKTKNLMERENKIHQKESLKDIHQDLKDIAVSLYNYLDVLDLPNNQFETRISQIITSLNKFYQEDTVVVAENVNNNVIIAEPSAPLFI